MSESEFSYLSSNEVDSVHQSKVISREYNAVHGIQGVTKSKWHWVKVNLGWLKWVMRIQLIPSLSRWVQRCHHRHSRAIRKVSFKISVKIISKSTFSVKVSRSRSFQIVTDRSRSLQIVPERSRALQIVRDPSGPLQIGPDRCRSLQIVPNSSRSFQIAPHHFRSL